MNLQMQNTPEDNSIEAFERELEAEYEKTRQTRKEIELMIEQSQKDLMKLTRQSSERNSQLQQIHAQFETMPRSDIKTAYSNAMDTQQRLLVTRGELDKLQNNVEALTRYLNLIEKIRAQFSKGMKPGGTRPGGGA